mmetsp:Transcript_66954/g.185011  ORF Transcript_66954/g.185011 Transcript_66954/m.185011 type:complete len:158 (+) Transcript_66954:59-532(+)
MPRRIWTRRLRADAPPELPITTVEKVMERDERYCEFKRAFFGSDAEPTRAQLSRLPKDSRAQLARLIREYFVEQALLESQTAVTQEGTVETFSAEERKTRFDDRRRLYSAEENNADKWSLMLHAVARRVLAEPLGAAAMPGQRGAASAGSVSGGSTA